MLINQGDIFWFNLDEPSGSKPGYEHPVVVIQNNLFNESRINTVVVCIVSSNLTRAKAPGNVMLKRGEAGLTKDSVAVVSQITTVNKFDLERKLGALSKRRLQEVLDGVALVFERFD